MGLFDKKFCDICGAKIGLLGNRKLEDGNLCKDCASKLSPWFSNRRNSTVADIKRQLAYRLENEKEVEMIRPSLIIGSNYKTYIDQNQRKFFVSRLSSWKKNNPDIISLDDIADVHIEIEEEKNEIMDKDKEGKSIPYDPPRYEYEYQFDVKIILNHPWIEEIAFELTNTKPDSPHSNLFNEYVKEADDLKMALVGKHFSVDASSFNNTYPKEDALNSQLSDEWICECGSKNSAAFCPNCGKSKPTPIAFCPNCGTKISDSNNPPKFCATCGNRLK